jgi:hypothetical protein
MHNLRLVGVHEDGEHLLLADDRDKSYRLPLDESLRAAALRDRPRLGQLQIEIGGGLRPREVQAMIRTGVSAEEVAHRSGWPLDKVRRYEGPILAEREYIASRAQQVTLRARGGSGPSATLASRVRRRLAERGVEPDAGTWDSSRGDDGQWTVTLTFPAGGRQRLAAWHFDPTARRVAARNDEARWLSEDDEGSGAPLPAPHMVSAPARRQVAGVDVYDVEAEGGLPGPSDWDNRAGGRAENRVMNRAEDRDQNPRDDRGDDRAQDRDDRPIDLMAAMRQHSAVGRRRGSGHRRTSTPARASQEQAPPSDALPLEQTAHDQEVMPARPPGAAPPVVHPSPRGATAAKRDSAELDSALDFAELAAEEPEAAAGGRGPRPTSRRAGRPRVPSWDDIVFGSPRRD